MQLLCVRLLHIYVLLCFTSYFSLFKLIRLIYIFRNYDRVCFSACSLSLSRSCAHFSESYSNLRVAYEMWMVVCWLFCFSAHLCDSTETRMCHYKTACLLDWLCVGCRALIICTYKALLRIRRQRFLVGSLCLNTFSLVPRLCNTHISLTCPALAARLFYIFAFDDGNRNKWLAINNFTSSNRCAKQKNKFQIKKKTQQTPHNRCFSFLHFRPAARWSWCCGSPQCTTKLLSPIYIIFGIV